MGNLGTNYQRMIRVIKMKIIWRYEVQRIKDQIKNYLLIKMTELPKYGVRNPYKD